LDVVQNLE